MSKLGWESELKLALDAPHEIFLNNFTGFATDFGIVRAVLTVARNRDFVTPIAMSVDKLTSFVEAVARGADVTALEIFVINAAITLDNGDNQHFGNFLSFLNSMDIVPYDFMEVNHTN